MKLVSERPTVSSANLGQTTLSDRLHRMVESRIHWTLVSADNRYQRLMDERVLPADPSERRSALP
jgi:hypothetical protein